MYSHRKRASGRGAINYGHNPVWRLSGRRVDPIGLRSCDRHVWVHGAAPVHYWMIAGTTPSGVPFDDDFARFSARTFLPLRVKPVRETAADSSMSSPAANG